MTEIIGEIPHGRTFQVYDGFEPSGRLHIAQGLGLMARVKRWQDLGGNFTIFIADWHAHLNGKGSLDECWARGQSMIEIWEKTRSDLGVDPVSYKWFSGLTSPDYFETVATVMKETSVARLLRCTPALGREEKDSVPASALLYAAMQVADMKHLGVDVAAMGEDQRKVNVLAREIAKVIGMKPPTLAFHELTPSLKEGGKMSKSDQSSAIFHGDDEKTIREKIAKAWCRPGVVEGNGILGIFRDCIFPWITIEVDGVMYADYSVLEAQYEAGKVHPKALKDACANALVHLMKV